MKSLEEGSAVVWVLKVPTIFKRETFCSAVVAVVRCLGDSSSSCKDFPDDILLVAIMLMATLSCKGENAVKVTPLLLSIVNHLSQLAIQQVVHVHVSNIVLGRLDLVGLGRVAQQFRLSPRALQSCCSTKCRW